MTPHHFNGNITVVADVSEGEPMYAKGYIVPRTFSQSERTFIEIHIHSPQDLQGGGWSRKVDKMRYDHGQTHVVE